MNKLIIKLVIVILIVGSIDRIVSLCLKNGIDSYYGLHKKADLVFIGHSRTELGIDTGLVQDILHVPVTKYAVCGTDIYTHFVMIRHYLTDRQLKPDTIVLNVDKNYLVGESPSVNNYTLFYPYLDDSGMKEYVYSNKASLSEYYERKIFHLLRFVELRNNCLKGLLGRTENYDWSFDVAKAVAKYKTEKENFKLSNNKIILLDTMIKYVKQHNVKIVLIDFPNVDFISGDDIYSAIVEKIAEDNGISYINISQEFTRKYNLFYDVNHLNVKGRDRFSSRIAREIQCIL